MSPFAQRFLIADRDPFLREGCRRTLAARGYAVELAADGLQCVAQLREHLPSVLVLDPQLLWGGGDGVLDWLRDERPLARLTVLLINDRGTQCLPDRLRRLVASCLERPRRLEELLPFIGRVVEAALTAEIPARQPLSFVFGRNPS